MKIKKITLDNIRCFEKLEVDLNSENQTKNWLIFLGDNGAGKTTILRSIAIGLSEEAGAAGLVDEIEGDWIRFGSDKASIKLEIEPYPNCPEKASITTKLKMNEYNEVEVRQSVIPKIPETFKWEDIFVCAYGAGRTGRAVASYPDYLITDSVYNLMRYDQALQNPELNIRRIETLGIPRKDIFNKIEHILMLDKGVMTMDFSGLKIKDPWAGEIPFGALPDGYQGSITWLMDFFGWKSLHEGKRKKVLKNNILDPSGIIILDEIEQHLHPKWQKKIIKLLHDEFPKVQFLVSTHSSLCVVGSTELLDEECSIIVLEKKENSVSKRVSPPPRRRRVDQVLTSYMFDLFTATDDIIKHDIERYKRLFNAKRTSKEEIEMQEIVKRLDEQFDPTESKLEKIVESAIHQSLQNLIKDYKKTLADKDPKPIDIEIKRQLKELFQ